MRGIAAKEHGGSFVRSEVIGPPINPGPIAFALTALHCRGSSPWWPLGGRRGDIAQVELPGPCMVKEEAALPSYCEAKGLASSLEGQGKPREFHGGGPEDECCGLQEHGPGLVLSQDGSMVI